MHTKTKRIKYKGMKHKKAKDKKHKKKQEKTHFDIRNTNVDQINPNAK